MDSLIDMESARKLVSDRSLWPRVRDFLWDFAPQVHASWLEGYPASAANSTGRVKAWLLSQLGVKAVFYPFEKGGFGRLLLLEGSVVLEIAKWLGALAFAGELRKVTSGAAVKDLKAKLPGVYPDVFGYELYFKGKGGKGKDKGTNLPDVPECSFADRIIGAGCMMLQSNLKDIPEELQNRLRLKLPKSYAELAPAFSDLDSNINLQLLLKLRFPEAYRLCCS